MQREITDDIHLGQTVNPSASTKQVKSIDQTSDFSNADGKFLN